METAWLQFQLTTGGGALPVSGASVTVTDPESGEYRVLVSDASGQTGLLPLPAPDAALSLMPNPPERPYALYNASVRAAGYLPVEIEGIQLFGGMTSIEPVELEPAPAVRGQAEEVYRIPENALEEEEPRMPESVPEEVPPGRPPRILQEVIIPSEITVHLGRPNDSSARNVTVPFPEYIKNVASSEIYPTWPEAALRANILAQISFALNRVFTEWYRSRGYAFDITNSTAYDQAYVHGRNLFDSVSKITDEIFNNYLRRQGAQNPLFAEYCNGTTVTCAGLSQWGTVPLAQAGYSPIEILRRYYGSDVEIASTDRIEAIPSSYPGTPLKVGSSGTAVEILHTQLARIRKNYPAVPAPPPGNVYTEATAASVRAFQKIFQLTQDGVVGPATWNKISYLYAAVMRLAELDSENIPLPSEPPDTLLSEGSRGETVRLLQYFLRVISVYYDSVPAVAIDGIFGPRTREAVVAFQKTFQLQPDGIVGPATWRTLYDVFLGVANAAGLVVAYPGNYLREGSRGENVRLMQEYLRALHSEYDLPLIEADGIFGPRTRAAVVAFQQIAGIAADGIIGPDTWERIVAARLLL